MELVSERERLSVLNEPDEPVGDVVRSAYFVAWGGVLFTCDKKCSVPSDKPPMTIRVAMLVVTSFRFVMYLL